MLLFTFKVHPGNPDDHSIAMKRFLESVFLITIAFSITAGVYGAEPSRQYAIKDTSLNKWHSFDMIEFTLDGVDAKIVFPDQPCEQRYWIWRARFWGHEPQVDIALLQKGFYLVYIDVADLYGSETAVRRFDDFYRFLVKNFHLNTRAVLEGMSRGGLIVYNWASENTDKVACIYADAPVCDIKSWPGGLGNGCGSKEDWGKCLNAYGLTESTVTDYTNIPVNNCVKIAGAGIPVLHVCGDQDTIVPVRENTDKLAEKFRAAGGNIRIIVKKGVGHHPHCLEDPKPIVDFILDNTLDKK